MACLPENQLPVTWPLTFVYLTTLRVGPVISGNKFCPEHFTCRKIFDCMRLRSFCFYYCKDGRGTNRLSHSGGWLSHSGGWLSHSGGWLSHSGGWLSHSGGWLSHSGGWLSHSGGWLSHSDGWLSHSGGWLSHSGGWLSHSGGWLSHSGGWLSHSGGWLSHSGGWLSHSGGWLSHSDGQHPSQSLWRTTPVRIDWPGTHQLSGHGLHPAEMLSTCRVISPC